MLIVKQNGLPNITVDSVNGTTQATIPLMFGSQAPTIEMNTSNLGSPTVRVIGVSSQQAPNTTNSEQSATTSTTTTEATQQQSQQNQQSSSSDEGAPAASNAESNENG